MGLPTINIKFQSAAESALKKSNRGVVGLILKDANTEAAGAHRMTSPYDIPGALGENNAEYIRRAFLGYVNPPREVAAYVLAADAAGLEEALAYFATTEVDYLAGPPDCSEAEASAIAAWVKERRAEQYTEKAVLPNLAADSEGVINFTTTGIEEGGKTHSAAQYCSRIAGLLAGTPLTISATYAPLPEVTGIDRLGRDAMASSIDGGQMILYHDGEKVKVARGVNSLTTIPSGKGEEWKKVKIVAAMDAICRSLRRTAEDGYIGKFANSYDNKCILITAIKGYFESLEGSGVLQPGSVVGIDLAAQEQYLKDQGVDTSKMSQKEIKEAATGDRVFLTASVKILDAIEDITLNVVM